MLKKLMITAAIGGLMVGAAPQTWAQSAPNNPAAAAPADAKIINGQGSDQMLSSNFIGTDVLGPDDKKIGDVTDVLFERNGQVVAYVVGVGGLLGLGAKNVALAPTTFEIVPGKDSTDTKLKLSMTKDQLEKAASFETMREKETAARRASSQTTGSATGGGMGAGSNGTQRSGTSTGQ